MSAVPQVVSPVVLAGAVKGHRPISGLAVLYAVGAGLCLMPWMPAPVALGLGALVSVAVGNPFAQATSRMAKIGLQSSVVLLGFGMEFTTALHAGLSGFFLSGAMVIITLLLGMQLARWLGVAGQTGLLVGAGTAICGGSAIAAVGSSIDADKNQMSVALGTVFLLNAVALYLFPLVGAALGLSPAQFGTWAAVAVHDVSSVIGSADAFGAEAVQIATTIKLTRTLWIVPLAIGLAWAVRRTPLPRLANASFGYAVPAQPARSLQVPWFIALFVLAGVVRSIVPPVADLAPTLTHIAKAGLVLTLFFIGTTLTRQTLSMVGWRPLAQATVLWIAISLLSLLAVCVLI